MAAVAKLGEPLSNQETLVLGLAADGLTDSQIAAKLIIGVDTVKTHMRRCYQKLGATGRVHAVRLAFHLDPEPATRIARVQKILKAHRTTRSDAPAGSRFARFYDELATALKADS